MICCSKEKANDTMPQEFQVHSIKINGLMPVRGNYFFDVKNPCIIEIQFSESIDKNSINQNIVLRQNGSNAVSTTAVLSEDGKTVTVSPDKELAFLSRYDLSLSSGLKSVTQGSLMANSKYILISSIDPKDKFPSLSDEALLTLIQKQTFKYFWDLGHPVSGMARERNTSGDLVTIGGTGFGLMSFIVGVERGFISRPEGLERTEKIVDFLLNHCTRYHGAFAHWVNGATGATQPFSAKDNGADLVETALLIQGLITSRQYFNNNEPKEILLRKKMNQIIDEVDWNWFQNGGQKVLFWHWSPQYNFEINMQIKGWNEAMIAYVLAASSLEHSIDKAVYDNGWASNGSMKNGNLYYDVKLPLGPSYGGPLFLSQYSFLGINPMGLSDAYANYEEQTKAHSQINYKYCVANPGKFNGYSNLIWGLTASDDNVKGYLAHSPTNDDGVISPTAAISSLPFTPQESMNALRYFYFKLGDKIFKQYGFIDAFNLSEAWFPDSFLAIDQGPQIIMIENYRSGLLWRLFMSAPEIKVGMKKLGFSGPDL